MRCNFVDFYFALYGTKRPAKLCASEPVAGISGMGRIPKLSDKHRSESPTDIKPSDINIIETHSRDESPMFKRELELNIDDDHYAIKDEPYDGMRVRHISISFQFICNKLCLSHLK